MAEQGVYCHQCRQKTRERKFYTCKNEGGKCSLKFCDPCIQNRYIKPRIMTLEEVNADDWNCPKCRGICNCSLCRNRHGLPPTGLVLPGSEGNSAKEPEDGTVPLGEGEQKLETPMETEAAGNSSDMKGKGKQKEPRQVKAKKEVVQRQFPLPEGVPVTTVTGVELHPQDVGHALQFVEFCGAFEEFLKFGKPQAESLLGELKRQRSGRPAQYSTAARFHTKLLSLIQEKEMTDEPLDNNSWFEDFRTRFSKSKLLLKELPEDFFSRGVGAYDSLDFSEKLRVLTFLCDEALGNKNLRAFMDNQNKLLKEAIEKVSAAKAKENDLNQQLSVAEAKYTIRDAAAPTLDEEAAVSRLKSQVAEAHTKVIEAEGLAQRRKHQSDIAHRTDMYLFDDDGRAFWQLSSRDGLLLQDVKTWDASETSEEKWDASKNSEEKWFAYGAETRGAVEMYCSSLRKKRWKRTLPSSSGTKEDGEEEEKAEVEAEGDEEDKQADE